MNYYFLFILLLNCVCFSLAKELTQIIADETANLLTLLEESEQLRHTLNEQETKNLDQIINKRKKLLDDLLNAEKKEIDHIPQNEQTELDAIIKKRIALLHQLLKNNKTKEILKIIEQVGKENFMLNVDVRRFYSQPLNSKEVKDQEVSIKPSIRNENETATNEREHETNEHENSKLNQSENVTKSHSQEITNANVATSSENEIYDNSETIEFSSIENSTEVALDTTVHSHSTKRRIHVIGHKRPRVKEKRLRRVRKPTTHHHKQIYRAHTSSTITTPDFKNYFDSTTPFVHNTEGNPHNDFKTGILTDDDVQFNEILQDAEKLYVTGKLFNFCFDNNSTDFNTNQYTSTTTPKTLLWSDKDVLKALSGDPFIQRLMKIYMKKNQEYKGARKLGHIQYFGYRK